MRWSLVLLALVMVGCPSRAPARAAHITGQITRATEGSGHITVVVEAVPGDAFGSPKALVTVDRSTRIFHADPDTAAQLEDLVAGATISVWFEGPVAESYPMQAKAGTLLIQTEIRPRPPAAPSRAPKSVNRV